MACPVVAGAAVLVRHYFAAGFYPTGAAVPANAYPKPSGDSAFIDFGDHLLLLLPATLALASRPLSSTLRLLVPLLLFTLHLHPDQAPW